MNAETNPQIRTVHKYGTVLYFGGVSITILTPDAPSTLFERDPALRISYAPIAPGGQSPVIQLHERLTLGDLCQAIGLKSYDAALPYEWVKAEYLSKGLPWPRGVWSYDEYRIMGDFVSVEAMLSTLGQLIADLIGYDGLCALDRSMIPEEINR